MKNKLVPLLLLLASCATIAIAKPRIWWEPSPSPNVTYVVYQQDPISLVWPILAELSGTNYVITNGYYGQVLTVAAKDIASGQVGEMSDPVTNFIPGKLVLHIGTTP